MTSPSEWLSAARPRTLPAAISPVIVGTGVAFAVREFSWWKALLALLVSVALQVGVNYANDYSDGIRGTDANRVGPMRLVGSGTAKPRTVRLAAFGCFGVAAAGGVALAATSGWWLLIPGALAIAAAWFYTGGPKPYGYAGFGELFVFVFFGLFAVNGTTYVQAGRITYGSVAFSIGIGLMACGLLVANNLRDVDTDAATGKRTLAVLLGDALSRRVYALMVAGALLASAVVGLRHRWVLLGLLTLPLAAVEVRSVLRGARGKRLISVLVGTGRLEFSYAILVALGMVISRLTG